MNFDKQGKLEISQKDLSEWMSESRQIYASQAFNGKLLRMQCNFLGIFKVEYGGRKIYGGNQMTHAIAAWKSV